VKDPAAVVAGALLRDARVRAGLTQQELAERAGVAQSVISTYESGRRQPALPTLMALVEAAGHDLVLGVRRQPGRLRGLSGPLGRVVRRRRRDLVAAAAARGVSNLRVFGSVARGEDRADSDVDLLADLPEGMGLFALGSLRSELSSILDAPVDLVPAAGLKPAVRANVERDLIAL
jgi:predicted nucleotidyltransferase/DNA-binding XRE family transcriptional regulator